MLDEISIVALGPTWSQCPQRAKENCEIWAANSMYRDRPHCDRVFLAHDIMKDIILKDKNFFKTLNSMNIPVYTNNPEPNLKNNIIYPIKDIVARFNVIFFLNVITYMIAYAITLEPQKISLYGVDLRPDSGLEHHKNEKGCVEFWLGMALGSGIKIQIPHQSFLMKRVIGGTFYGFQKLTKANGIIHAVPESNRKRYNQYKLVPLDKKGQELSDEAFYITLSGLILESDEVEQINLS